MPPMAPIGCVDVSVDQIILLDRHKKNGKRLWTDIERLRP